MSTFLNLINSALNVEVETKDFPSSALPLVTKFTVKNVAKKSAGMPEMFFEEVSLTLGVPPNMHVEKHTDLAMGESFTYEHHSHYSDLGKIVYNVEGKISPSRLLRVTKPVTNITARVSSISISSYVEILKDINIHRWLREVIERMLLPAPNTTEADIKAQQDKFQGAIKEIADTKNQLGHIYDFITRSSGKDRQNITNHRALIEKYLTNTAQACSELRKMLETNNAKTIDSARKTLINNLSAEVYKIDEASQKLLM